MKNIGKKNHKTKTKTEKKKIIIRWQRVLVINNSLLSTHFGFE